MEYLHYIYEFISNPILDVLMGLVGLILVSGIFLLYQMALAKAFCAKMTDIEVFGFKYSRNSAGKWEYRGHRVKLAFSGVSAIDIENHPEIDGDKMIQKDKSHMLATSLLTTITGLGISAGCIIWSFTIYYAFPASVVFLTGFWVLLFTVGRLILVLSTMTKIYSKNSLGSYQMRAISLLRSGVPYEKLDLKSVRELNLKKVWETERKMYFPVYFQYLDACGFYDRMPEAVDDVERILNAAAVSKVDIGVYMNLIYYYSYHRPTPSAAKEYYHRIINDVEKDTDPNTMRIRGFYELNCFGDPVKARELSMKALEGLDTVSIPVEREYERKCIAKLNNAIDNFNHV